MAHPVSIRKSLFRNLQAMLVFIGIAILGTTMLSARRAARLSSESIIGKTLETVEAQLEAFVSESARQLALTRAQAEAGLLGLTTEEEQQTAADPESRFHLLRARRNAVLAPVITAYPQISSLMVADGRGREHMLLRSGGAWRNRVTCRDLWGDEVRWLEWTDTDAVARERRETLAYRPRERPWYRGAVAGAASAAAPMIHWTEPYTFFTTKEPGITTSTAYDLGDGIERVIGFDILLKDISAFTRQIRVEQRGRVAILTDDRRVIGLPRDPRFDDPDARASAYLQTASAIGLTLVTDAAAAFADAPPDRATTVRFESDGEPWWGRTSPFALSPERRLWIAIAVPESDLVGNLRGQQALLLGIVLIVLVVGVMQSIALARRFSAPIEALVAQTDRLGRGDFGAGPPIRSNVTEVRRLADAHDTMREGVQAMIKLEKVERDLDLAREIQRGLLPVGSPDIPGIEIAGWNQPADKTGGDYYDWLTLPNGQTVVILADVTGHGIGPALIVAVYRAYMRASMALGETRLSEALRHVNNLLCADTPPERFVTAAVAVIDADGAHMVLASAGHGPNLFYEARTGTVHRWGADEPPLAITEDLRFDRPRQIDLETGDVLLLVTDGFFEWFNADGEQYGIDRLSAFLAAHHDRALPSFIETLYQEVLGHARGTAQDDDLTVVLVRKT